MKTNIAHMRQLSLFAKYRLLKICATFIVWEDICVFSLIFISVFSFILVEGLENISTFFALCLPNFLYTKNIKDARVVQFHNMKYLVLSFFSW